jgi:hypothetical protein
MKKAATTPEEEIKALKSQISQLEKENARLTHLQLNTSNPSFNQAVLFIHGAIVFIYGWWSLYDPSRQG